MTGLGAVIGAGIGLGLWLVAAGLRGHRILPPLTRIVPSAERTETAIAWLAGAALAGVVVFVATGWPVAGIAAVGACLWAPRSLAAVSRRRDTAERTEAIASWTEMIRDNIAGAAGLEQALIAASSVAPRAIAPEVTRFARRLERASTVDALVALGADLDHPSADLVVVALVNAARMEARDLAPLLGRLAETIRADVRMRLRVEVGRARIRTSARIVVATTVVTIGFMFVFSRRLLDAYDSATGQLWLVLVGAVFALGGWMLQNYGRLDMPDCFAARASHQSETS